MANNANFPQQQTTRGRKKEKLSPFNWKIKFYAAAARKNAGAQFLTLAGFSIPARVFHLPCII